MSDQTETPPAGWYNDPTNANQQRWWDGAQWSPSTRPLQDGPPPFMPPPTSPPSTPGPSSNDQTTPMPSGQLPTPVEAQRRSGRTLLLLGLALVLIFGVGIAFVSAADDSQIVAEPERPTNEATPPPETDESDESESVASDTAMGTRAEPLAYEQPVDLRWNVFGDADGSRWTTTVGPPRDITDEVLAANEFNSPPPDGVRYVGFDVELTLLEAAKEPLAPSFNFDWEILGGESARVLNSASIETESFGCGVIGNQFDDFGEVFAGGTLAGTVCIPIPAEDLDHPDTRVALRFSSDERAIFGP